MNTTFLHSYLITVDSGSMSEAARRLDLTPAAIAQQVRTLEKEMGVKLLVRSGRTVKQTEAGAMLATHARTLLKDINHLKALLNTDSTGGELRLGSINTAMLSLLPKMLIKFTKTQPDTKVFIYPGPSAKLYEDVLRGDLDAAICLHPNFVLSKSLSWVSLCKEPLVLLAPKNLSMNNPMEILKNKPFIRYDRNVGGGKLADQCLRRMGITPNERLELNSILSIAMMVEAELGVSIVPDINSPLLNALHIKKIALPQALDHRDIGILSQRTSLKTRLIKALKI